MFSGATSTAARIKALLYDPFLKLPAKARTLIFSDMRVARTNKMNQASRFKLAYHMFPCRRDFKKFEKEKERLVVSLLST
jgi:hypothetical protein